jgi:hypothetical protein
MANAPAGWYEQPGAPGVTRYWDGAAWLPHGVGPAQQTSAFSPQSTVFTPTAPHEPDVIQPEPALIQVPAATTATPSIPAPTPAAVNPEAVDSVPWDVVGVARTPQAPSRDVAQRPEWQASPEQPFAFNPAASTAFPQQWTPAPYAPPLMERRKLSGLSKVGIGIAIAVIGFGVRWGFGFFFGGDFSADGPIEVDVPAYWTTYTASGPDISYAMDGNWQDVTATLDLPASPTGMRLIDARALSTDLTGNQALLLLYSSTEPLPGVEVPRDVFADAFDEIAQRLEAVGADIGSREKVTILTSQAGDHWGFSQIDLTLGGAGITYFSTVGLVDGYVVGAELIVPEGVELTKHDLLAVANSVRESP